MAKYHYFYQSRENANLDGWIAAKNRDDAYAQLRKVGIKPCKVVGKDPIAWRRWAAIAVLAAALAGTYTWLALRPDPVAPDEQFVRHQIYGAESVIRNGISTGWSACGLDEGERYLARYAQPGVKVAYRRRTPETASAVEAALARHLEVEDSELLEYRQLKQIVESIKHMILSGKLYSTLHDLDRQAQERYETIVSQMITAEGITESLKAENQMEWVRRMNNIRNRAEETIREEMINN